MGPIQLCAILRKDNSHQLKSTDLQHFFMYRVTQKWYFRLTKHQIVAFCYVVQILLDSKYLFIDLYLTTEPLKSDKTLGDIPI